MLTHSAASPFEHTWGQASPPVDSSFTSVFVLAGSEKLPTPPGSDGLTFTKWQVNWDVQIRHGAGLGRAALCAEMDRVKSVYLLQLHTGRSTAAAKSSGCRLSPSLGKNPQGQLHRKINNSSWNKKTNGRKREAALKWLLTEDKFTVRHCCHWPEANYNKTN